MSLTIEQKYGSAVLDDFRVTGKTMKVWWIWIKLTNECSLSYPVRQKLNRNQLRAHLRHFKKYRSIVGYDGKIVRYGADVGREKAMFAGWFNYLKLRDNIPYDGRLIFRHELRRKWR